MNKFVKIFLNSSLIPDEKAVINDIFPNIWVLISHIIAFVILLILVIFLAWKPTKKYIKKRSEEIQKNYKLAEELRLEFEQKVEVSNQKIIDSKITAANIIHLAEVEAKQKQKEIEIEAINKANNIEKEKKEQLLKQEQELKKNFNYEASKIAIETVEIFLSKKINDTNDLEFINNIVNDLEKRLDKKRDNF